VTTFHVKTEEDAWELLRRSLEGQLTLDDAPQVDFEGWPFLSVHLPGTPIEGSISPTMMVAFLELQKAVNRAYLLVSSNTADLRALTDQERERLEMRVTVAKGSSDYAAELSKIVERIGTEAVAKMTSTDIVITVLGVALIIGGVYAFKAWLNSKAEQRKSEADEAGTAALIELQKETLNTGTEHLKLLADALKRQPLLDDIEAVTEPARSQMVKSIGEEGGGTAYGVSLSSDAAREISSQKRQQSEHVRLAGHYRVVKVDTSSPDGFRVTLADDAKGTEIVASMQDALVSEDHKQAIQNAEWRKMPVYVELSAKKLRNRFVDAIVLNASEPTRQPTETK
jgi:hypothetical protein